MLSSLCILLATESLKAVVAQGEDEDLTNALKR